MAFVYNSCSSYPLPVVHAHTHNSDFGQRQKLQLLLQQHIEDSWLKRDEVWGREIAIGDWFTAATKREGYVWA